MTKFLEMQQSCYCHVPSTVGAWAGLGTDSQNQGGLKLLLALASFNLCVLNIRGGCYDTWKAHDRPAGFAAR